MAHEAAGHGAQNGKQRKYQVFISSTFKDLAAERKKAVEVVVSRGHIPVDLSLFAARSRSDLEVITSAIKECQIYLVILGHRYGSLVEDRTIFSMLRDADTGSTAKMSYTEFEYRLAEAHNLTILPFILDDNEIAEQRRKLSHDVASDEVELQNHSSFYSFLEYVKSSRFYKPFRSGEEFGVHVLASLEDAIRDDPRPGWILEPQERVQQELIRELMRSVSRNPFILQIARRLSSFDALDSRSTMNADKKIACADFFAKTYHSAVLHQPVNLFLESGTTVAHLAQTMAPRLLEHLGSDDRGNPRISISTNNVLAYLLLWLCHGVPVHLFPWGGPESLYGAIFGSIAHLENQHPSYDQSPLSRFAKDEIQRLMQLPLSTTPSVSPTLLLGAISGLQLSAEHRVVPDTTPQGVREQIDGCYGLHVGSYKNKLFKRFLYETGHATVILLDSSKIDCPIVVGKCHFVCDEELTWDCLSQTHPLAFCVGCTQDEHEAHVAQFRQMGYEVIRGDQYNPCTAFVARNRPFIDQFEVKVDFIPPGS